MTMPPQSRPLPAQLILRDGSAIAVRSRTGMLRLERFIPPNIAGDGKQMREQMGKRFRDAFPNPVSGCRGATPMNVLLALSLSATPALAGTSTAPSGSDSWTRSTQVEEAPAACAGLDKAFQNRVMEVNEFQVAINKARNGPAPNVLGLLKTWMGQPYTAESLRRKQEQLEGARRRADAINELRTSAGCPYMDIEEELRKLRSKKQPAENR